MIEEPQEDYAESELNGDGDSTTGGAERPLEAAAAGDESDEPVSAEVGDADLLEPATPEDVAATAEEFVTGLLRSLQLEGEVSSSVEGDTATIEVSGESLGGLIGRRGQTLDALQEITRTAVQRRLKGRVRVLVDVEGYRARRRASLAEYARSIAERAKERGTEIELEPMTAYERKVVHDAVAEIEGATSFSEGVEPNRKVVVRGE